MTELDWGALQKEAATAGILPDGEYPAIVTSSQATNSSTGKPMIKVKFRITDGPHKDKPIWTQFVISAESAVALRIFFQHMAAMGLDTGFFAQNPGIDVVAKNLENRGCILKLGSREWQGVDRNEVKGISPLATGGPLPPGLVVGAPVVGPSPMTPPAPTTAPVPATPPVPTTPVVGTTPQVGTTSAPPASPF